MRDGYYLVKKTQTMCGISQAKLQKEKSVYMCVCIYVF